MPAEGRDSVNTTVIGEAGIVVSLNGENHVIQAGSSVADLLASIGLEPRKIAVERNEAIVPRSLCAATRLETGDSLEIVHFIGGG
jgi:thiamine biosynthesis protein ThiS